MWIILSNQITDFFSTKYAKIWYNNNMCFVENNYA